jgi:hypothetical protein
MDVEEVGSEVERIVEGAGVCQIEVWKLRRALTF